MQDRNIHTKINYFIHNTRAMQTTKNEARDRAEMFALLVTQENIYEELRNNPADYTIQEAEELLDRINKKIIHEEEQHEIRDAISA